MLAFSILTEDTITRGDIGAGLGGLTGRLAGRLGGAALGGLSAYNYAANAGYGDAGIAGIAGALLGAVPGGIAGGQLGRAIGRKVISDADKPADFTKGSHRIGYLADPKTKGWGIAADVVDPTGLTNYVGNKIYNSASDNGAKRIGYKTLGRTGALMSGPIVTGAFSPENVRSAAE